MTPEQIEELRATWREAAAALSRLRSLLVAAGVQLDDAGPAEPVESAEDRRRRLARERARRHRERHADSVTKRDAGVTASRSERYASVTKRDGVTQDSVTKRDASVTQASRAPAFLIGESIYPLSFLESYRILEKPPHPTAEERDATPAVAPIGVTLAVDPGADLADELFGPIESDPVAPMAEEPASLARGATIDPLPRSVSVPVADRAPEGDSGRPALALLPGVPEEPESVTVVWSAYLEAIKPTRARLTSTRRQLIVRRLQDYPVADLVRAIRGYGRSSWHRGDNPRGRPYQALELWLRDAAHVEAGWAFEVAQPTAKKRSGPALFDGIEAEWQAIEQQRAAERDLTPADSGEEQRQ